MITQKLINDISYRIIGCAIEVHKYLGPVCWSQYITLFDGIFEKMIWHFTHT
jgi:hypothetical protein